jgi:putative phosphoribosyl transferase
MCAMPDPPGFEREIILAAGDAGLPGPLVIPQRADGMVVFAHGSGSSRRPGRRR